MTPAQKQIGQLFLMITCVMGTLFLFAGLIEAYISQIKRDPTGPQWIKEDPNLAFGVLMVVVLLVSVSLFYPLLIQSLRKQAEKAKENPSIAPEEMLISENELSYFQQKNGLDFFKDTSKMVVGGSIILITLGILIVPILQWMNSISGHPIILWMDRHEDIIVWTGLIAILIYLRTLSPLAKDVREKKT